MKMNLIPQILPHLESDACMIANLDYQRRCPNVQTRNAHSIYQKPQEPSSLVSCRVTVQTVTPLNRY